MKKEVLLFIFDGCADWEGAYIGAELNDPASAYVVKTVSIDKQPKTSMAGLRLLPDYGLDDVPPDFAMLILLGGTAWEAGANGAVLPLVAEAMRRNIPVGAICAAVNFLAEHGYLDHIRHSGNTAAYLKAHAPNYQGEQYFVEQQVVCDGKVVTANGTATLEFARAILLLLDAKPAAEVEEWYQIHKGGFYPA